MKEQEKNQKPISVKQLVEATRKANFNHKKGEAMISIIKQEDETAFIKWSGNPKDLLDAAYTLLQNDVRIAAIVCRATKDYVDSLKADPNAWVRLTNEVAKFDGLQPEKQGAMKQSEGKEEAS